MRVELKALKPNPFRNFKVDPIDEQVVAALKESIKDNPAGFWGGIVARKKNGVIEIAFGHHRIKAAIAAGIREDDVKVSPDISDAEMIRMYANENATQRGNSGTAIAGSVASACKFLLKGVFTGDVGGFPPRSKKALETLQGQAVTERGLGWDLILDFLAEIPGVNQNTVKQQLANLKASGDYDEIVEEVKAEIEEENKEKLRQLAEAEKARKRAEEEERLAEIRRQEATERRKEAARLERIAKEETDRKRAETEARRAEEAQKRAEEEAKLAEKRRKQAEEQMKEFDALRKTKDAMDKAAGIEREVTFDFEGVAQHLKVSSHIDVFRNLVTGEGISPYLPVNRQGALAKRLVDTARKDGVELSGRYIRENVTAMVLNVRGTERKFAAEDRDALKKQDWSAKTRLYQEEFARHARGMLAAAIDLSDHARKRPQGVTLHVTAEFREACRKAEQAINLLRKAKVL
jgi:hypothetical protein